MNSIKRRIIIYVSIICFWIILCALLFVLHREICNAQTWVITAFIITAGILLIRCLIIDVNNLKIAKLIMENSILNIKTAAISEISGKAYPHKFKEDTEIVVSYFGILFDGKIVKFNQDGVRLTAVDIGNDFISFTYGNEKQMQNIRILRPNLEPAAMVEIINKFRFETGITPTMVGR
jgi:phosphoglycerol transferase MdoB-like AlkP superfamily enzyme